MAPEHANDQVPLSLLAGRFAGLLEGELFEQLQASGYPDLRPRHSSLLTSLEPTGARLTVLAERAGVSPQTMGELVDDLEAKGYLERTPDPTDRRARLIRFTDRGLNALRECLAIADRIERRLLDRVGRRRYDEARRTLSELLEHGAGD